jgi:hypothetical protein
MTGRQRKLTKDHRRIMQAVLADVRNERQRQIAEEGYHPSDDDDHDKGELVRATCAYLRFNAAPAEARELWPWNSSRPKSDFRPKHHRRNLVIAAALILAELERLERERERHDTAEPQLPLRHG